VALAGLLAFLLWGSAVWAGVVAILLATESLNFVQSRIAMLDIFLALFVLLGFVLLVVDRRRQETRPPGGIRPIRLAAGVAFGAAIAVKWSGLLALVGAIVLSVAWMVSRFRARARSDDRPDLATLRRAWTAESAGLLLGLVLVPAVVYMLPWLPWIAERHWDLGEWYRHHLDMLGYHWNLETVKRNGEPIHPYLSPAWSWFLLRRPVAYYWDGEPCCAEILGIGSPALFWGGLIVVPYLAFAWWRRRDWRVGAILVPILAQYLPWLLVSRPLFLFYMTPVTPFLALGAAATLRDLGRRWLPDRRPALAIAAAVVAASIVVFAFFWPVLVGQHVSHDTWSARVANNTVLRWV
jgi:dolichyl-phosphate-mannose--protein O-mannosyl transferase